MLPGQFAPEAVGAGFGEVVAVDDARGQAVRAAIDAAGQCGGASGHRGADPARGIAGVSYHAPAGIGDRSHAVGRIVAVPGDVGCAQLGFGDAGHVAGAVVVIRRGTGRVLNFAQSVQAVVAAVVVTEGDVFFGAGVVDGGQPGLGVHGDDVECLLVIFPTARWVLLTYWPDASFAV